MTTVIFISTVASFVAAKGLGGGEVNAADTKCICMCLETKAIPEHEEKKYTSEFKYLGKAPKHQILSMKEVRRN